MRRRLLPKYVTAFLDRHGRERLRFRRKGFEDYYFKAKYGTDPFRDEYRACLDGAANKIRPGADKIVPGTIHDLIARYCAVPSRLGPSATTQNKIRNILEKFRAEHGQRFVDDVEFEHIDAIIAAKQKKKKVGKRMEGGDEAARKLRKELVRLFDFAVKSRMRATNPVIQSERVKVPPSQRSKGFHTWTEPEIAQYRAHHKLGTKARLAMELMLWTDQRRIDAIRMGRQHITDGRIKITQSKTGKELLIPVAPQLLEAIVAMPKGKGSHLCFLVTEWGKPFTNAGFGNWFRDQCDAAGLPQCSAHGLRKATMRRMAELGLSNQSMKAVSGHSKDDEVARYTREASQKHLADGAIKKLVEWEMSNPDPELDKTALK